MFLSSSSNEPLTLDQVYSSCLDSLGFGHALWEPELNDTGEVHLGDVGFVQDGSFVRLFNLDSSVEEWKVTRWDPAYQPEPLPEGALKIKKIPGKFSSGQYCSHGVTSTDIHGSAAVAAGAPVSAELEVGYTCSTGQGAALTLKSEGHVEGIYSSLRLKRYISRHYDQWLAYARNDADHDVKFGDLVVVTSCVKTTPDWAACVFTHRSSASHLSLEANAGGMASVSAGASHQTSITTKPIQRRGQLYHAEGRSVEADLTKSDQCVTIKRLKVRRRWFFRLVAGAGYHNLPDPDDKQGFVGWGASTEEEIEMPGPEDQGANADFLDILLAYELEVSGARIAVGDDDEVETLLNGQPVIDFASYLRYTQPRVEMDEDGVAFLCVEDLIRSEQEQRFGCRDSLSDKYVEPSRVSGSLQLSPNLSDGLQLPQTARELWPSHPAHEVLPSIAGSSRSSHNLSDDTAREHWPSHPSAEGPHRGTGSSRLSINLANDSELRQKALKHRPSHPPHPPISAADRAGWPQITHKDAGTLTYSHIWLGPTQAKARPAKYKSVVFGDQTKMSINRKRCVSLSADGKLLAAATGKDIVVWRLQDGLTVQKLQQGKHAEDINEIAFSPDSQFIVSGGDDKLALVWSIETGGIVYRLKGHKKAVVSAVFSPDGMQIATRSKDSLRLWHASSGELLHSITDLEQADRTDIFFSPDSSRIAARSDDSAWNSGVAVFDCHTGERTATLRKGSMWCMAFSPESDRLATGSSNGDAFVWDAESGKVLLELREHTRIVEAVAFSPDGGEVATASEDGTVVTCDSRTGECRFIFRVGGIRGIDKNRVQTVAYSPRNDFIACGADNTCIWVWHRKTGAFVAAFQEHTGWIERVIFTPDGWDLLSYGRDHIVRLWSIRDALRLS